MQVFGLGRARQAGRRGGYGYRLGTRGGGSRMFFGWFVAALAAGGAAGFASIAFTNGGRATIASKAQAIAMAAQGADTTPLPPPLPPPGPVAKASDVPISAFRSSTASTEAMPMVDMGRIGEWSSAGDAGAVHWRNCNHAWAAGAAPINRGEPGYRWQLDGDNDGIACEPFHRRGRRR